MLLSLILADWNLTTLSGPTVDFFFQNMALGTVKHYILLANSYKNLNL